MLDALESAEKNVDYYALDLSLAELERTFAVLPKDTYKHVRCHRLLGTYNDGLSWLKHGVDQSKPLCIMTMGSSLGNFGRDEAAKFLRNFANIMSTRDMLLIGLDACQDELKVFHAYNDKEGKTHDFILNGLTSINNITGHRMFDPSDWTIVGRYNSTKQCHQAFYQAKRDVFVEGSEFKAGDQIRVEESYKYSQSQRQELWKCAGLESKAIFANSNDNYREYNECLLVR